MRPLTAAELLDVWERGYAGPPVRKALALLAAACPETPADDLAKLGIGRRDRLLLELRERTFGPWLTGSAACPSCGEKVEIQVPVRDLLAAESAPDARAGTLSLAEDGWELRFRIKPAGLEPDAGRLRVAHLDLADLGSVRAFASAWSGPLHILVNNAGVMALPALTRSPEGWEAQLATNHLGHFALAQHLHGALAAAGGARIVSVASIGHRRGTLDFDDLGFERGGYSVMRAYGRSKLANVLFAAELARRLADKGVTSNSLHPGSVSTH